MTMPSTADVTVVTPAQADNGSYIDWPAIIAGIVLAAAISLVLLTFGSAIGLGFADFRAGEGVSPIWIAIVAASWLLWVQISSFMAGAYLTGRMRRRHGDATEHEVDVRDGTHGLLVWGGALVVGALIAVGGLNAAANAVGSAAATLTTAASNAAGEAEGLDPNAYFVDMLFRPAGPAAAGDTPAEAPAPAAQAPAPAAGAPAAPAAATPAPAVVSPPAQTGTVSSASAEVRAEAGRIFAQGVIAGEITPEDRAYLAQLVAQNSTMSEEEASARVDEVMTAVDTAKAEAADVAEEARKMGVLAAFLTAASLLVSAAAAFWAAQKGGRHRDEGTAFVSTFRSY